MLKKLYFLLVLIAALSVMNCAARGSANFSSVNARINIGRSLYILEDKSTLLSLSQVIARPELFIANNQDVPNFQLSASSWWIRITIKNSSDDPDLQLDIEYPPLETVRFFYPAGKGFSQDSSGTAFPFDIRKIKSENHIFLVHIPTGTSTTVYLNIRSGGLILLPVYLGTAAAISGSEIDKSMINGLYFGIILVMLLYNLFLYFSTRDKNYLLYVIYIFFVGLSQAALGELTFRYLWPGNTWLNLQSMTTLPALNGLAVVLFFRYFLDLRKQLENRLIYLDGINLVYVLTILLSLAGFYQLSLNILQFTAIIGSLFLFFVSAELIHKGYRPAIFFLIAWSFFLSGIIIFVLRNFNILPFNSFTDHVLLLGSGAEVTLLSFALADRINILKKEKEESQSLALNDSRKNEKLILDLNMSLEIKVYERTEQLTTAMEELQQTMDNLKNTQAQLVDAEKMASLGQLTAGIAHEINNPINFVTSNIKPLRRDIDDLYQLLDKFSSNQAKMDPAFVQEVLLLNQELDIEYVKTEIDLLLKGIDEGSSRTAEIIRGLKLFARVDEQDIKEVDLNEGIESTLLLLNSRFRDRLRLDLRLGSIPRIECYAGKLNQVFMNIITNSIYAINSLHGEETTGLLYIETRVNNLNQDEVIILIRDNGTGMDEEVKLKIFDPFFTTKPAGEGTGLGLSIVQQIVIGHKGSIEVHSELLKGTEFKIILPVTQ